MLRVVGPVEVRLSGLNAEHEQYFVCLRSVLAYVRGCGPLLAAQFGRRGIPPHLRPSLTEFEAACNGSSAQTAVEPAAVEEPSAEA